MINEPPHVMNCTCDWCCIRRHMMNDAWIICVQCGQKYKMDEEHVCKKEKR